MSAPSVRRAVRDNGLSLGFGVLFLLARAGQALTGQAGYNSQQLSSGGEQISFGQYLVSSSFAVDVAENWQSEYLQFFLYIFATVWLLQRGSPESKEIGWAGYLGEPDFWNRNLQNWQSELLAVGSMAIFAVYLRQRGSSESKQVGAPHQETSSTS